MQGKSEENTWAFAKARYDAETFWYRGNASIDVIPDTAFDAAAKPDRNVILYGNADTNAAWDALLADGYLPRPSCFRWRWRPSSNGPCVSGSRSS